jgi:hypothetical protein
MKKKKKEISQINPNDSSYLHKKAKFIADHEKSTEESDHSQLQLQRENVKTCKILI